jgi:hypothetical protein
MAKRLVLVSLLLLMAVLAWGSSMRESITVDEVAHIGAGVAYLQKFDMRMNEEHPPLAKALAALPLVARGVHSDYSDLSWSFSGNGVFNELLGEWAWGHAIATKWNDPRSTVLWARAPMLFLTLALGYVIYAFATELGGPWGGLLCLAVYASTPTFLAFGPLVLTDTAVTLFCILTIWAFAELWQAPTRLIRTYFGCALAAALLSKFSAGLLLISFLGFSLSLRWLPLKSQPHQPAELRAWRALRRRYVLQGILLASTIVYVVYLILSWHQPSDALKFIGHSPIALVIRRLLMPAWLYIVGLLMFALQSSRPTFILGHSYAHGVWFYFPALFALKSTLAFLALLIVAIAVSAISRRKLPRDRSSDPAHEFHSCAIWLSLAVFSIACFLSRLDISIRHFMMPIALIILLLAPLPHQIADLYNAGWRAAKPIAALVGLLALCSLLTVVFAFPYYIPFVNTLSFGRPAYSLVNDSNLDWNQSLPQAEDFVRSHGLTHVLIDEYGMSDPSVYVPQSTFWNCQEPSPSDTGQWAIVSAGMIEDGHNCLWLTHYSPEPLAGSSMYAIHLPAVIPPAGGPAGPPLAAEFHYFGGMNVGRDPRLVFLNCILDPKQLQPTMDWMLSLQSGATKK